MTVQSIKTRLTRLEAGRKRSNEVLLVWRRPDAVVTTALAGARFSPGDKVICAEWFDDGPLPTPRWYEDRVTKDLDPAASASLHRCLGRIRDDAPRDPAFAPIPFVPPHKVAELTDNELLHFTIGVAT